ncbi:MAG: hypothetical protein EBR86_17845 [Planctomycetia bacterium]|nr:hypothetical protein [Planctomycetia bacterium]
MVHYSCDACKRPIHPQNDVHHVLKIEVFPAVDDLLATDCCDEDDHLEEIQSVLEQGSPDGAGTLDESPRLLRFDLCDVCRKRFLRNPLGIAPGKQLDFSPN